LGGYTEIPAILPLLETFLEIFSLDGVLCGLLFCLNFLHVIETPQLKRHFDFREEEEVAGGQNGGVVRDVGQPPLCFWPETTRQTVPCEQERCRDEPTSHWTQWQQRTDNTLNNRLSNLNGRTDRTETRQATSQRIVLRSAFNAAGKFQPESAP
jgi:hypothetical protein